MRGKAHSDELREEVKTAILAGLGISEVAQKYNLPKSTVCRIRDEVVPNELERVGTEKRERLDDLLLDCLASNLRAQKAITDAVFEQEFIRKQTASDFKLLYETFADKAVRLLETASAAGVGEDPEEDAE